MHQSIWDSNSIPDQKGRVVIVAGSSSGIGYEAARMLANKNAEVIVAVRNQEKGNSAVQRIKAQHRDANVRVMIVDLANLKSVRRFADGFKKQYQQLNILINNAGVMIPPYSKTEDGFELQFGTNHLGHFALTGMLLDLLKKTADSRIVNVSSVAHKLGKLDFDDLNWEKRKYSAQRAYGDSKLANLYFTYSLSDRLKQNGANPTVTAAHPGWTATELQRHSGFVQFLNRFFAMPIEQGALPTLRAALDENAESGDYYGPDGFLEWKGYPVKVSSNKLSHDQKIAAELWRRSEEMSGVRY